MFRSWVCVGVFVLLVACGTDPEPGVPVSGTGQLPTTFSSDVDEGWVLSQGVGVDGSWVLHTLLAYDHSGPDRTDVRLVLGCVGNRARMALSVPWEPIEVPAGTVNSTAPPSVVEVSYQRDDPSDLSVVEAYIESTVDGVTTLVLDHWFTGDGDTLRVQVPPKNLRRLGEDGVAEFDITGSERVVASLPCFDVLETWKFSRYIEYGDGVHRTFSYYTEASTHSGSRWDPSPVLVLFCEGGEGPGNSPRVYVRFPWETENDRFEYRRSGAASPSKNSGDLYNRMEDIVDTPGDVLFVRAAPVDGSHEGTAQFDVSQLEEVITLTPCFHYIAEHLQQG